MNCGDKSLHTSSTCGLYSFEPSWRDVRSICALIFTFSFTPRKFWRPSHIIIQGNVTFWIKVFEWFEVVIAYFALVNLGWFSKHFISFQKLPTVIFRSHCSTVVYKWNWTMYMCMCVYPSWVSIYLCSPEERQITSLPESICETHFFQNIFLKCEKRTAWTS